MKKYFMKGTDDELEFGDMIEIALVGEEDGVVKHSHMEVKFLPEFVDDLLESDVIEEREVEDEEEEDDLLDFSDDFRGFKEAVAQDIEELLAANASLEKCMAELKKRVVKLEETVATLKEVLKLQNKTTEKPASPKKK